MAARRRSSSSRGAAEAPAGAPAGALVDPEAGEEGAAPSVGIALVLEKLVKQRLRHPQNDSMDVRATGCAVKTQRVPYNKLSAVVRAGVDKYHTLRTKQQQANKFFNRQLKRYRERIKDTEYTSGLMLNGTQARPISIDGTQGTLRSATTIEPVPVGARLLTSKMVQWIEALIADPTSPLHRFAAGTPGGSCEAAVSALTGAELHAIADELEAQLEALEASPELTRVKRRNWVDSAAPATGGDRARQRKK